MVYIRCTRCGRELRKQAGYCHHCGVPTGPGAGQPGRREAGDLKRLDESVSATFTSVAEDSPAIPDPPRSLAGLLLLLSLLVFMLAWYATG